MSRLAALICGGVLALAGCGFGAGNERAGSGVSVRVTRDFGHRAIATASLARVREDETVMRVLRSRFDVGTRFGGRFVQSIGGLEGGGPTGERDWFYFVNGVEADKGAAEYELSPGDRVQWDYRDWGATMRVPAIVGSFPEPFRHGLEGRRLPVRVECDESGSAACKEARARLDAAGVSSSGASLGAPGTQNVARLAVARWPAARIIAGANTLEDGPEASGVFARFAADGSRIDLLDERGEVARTVRPGDGVGLVVALAPRAMELSWLVTGLDERGVDAAVRALDGARLRDAFAVAVDGTQVEKLPLVSP